MPEGNCLGAFTSGCLKTRLRSSLSSSWRALPPSLEDLTEWCAWHRQRRFSSSSEPDGMIWSIWFPGSSHFVPSSRTHWQDQPSLLPTSFRLCPQSAGRRLLRSELFQFVLREDIVNYVKELIHAGVDALILIASHIHASRNSEHTSLNMCA